MSVYWNTQANGTLKLDGDWTDEAVNAFLPVLEVWEMDGDYGLWECGKLSESLSATFTASFGSYDYSTFFSEEYGWNEFTEALNLLNKLTCDWIRYTQDSRDYVEHPLRAEQYNLLLKLMHENNLSISIKFDETTYIEGKTFETQDEGTLTSDGKELKYNKRNSKVKMQTWKEYGKTALDSAVDFFMNFIEDANAPEVRKWVQENIAPTDLFEDDDIAAYLFEEKVEEEVLQDFINKFSPETDTWHEFFQEIKDELEWFTNDESEF